MKKIIFSAICILSLNAFSQDKEIKPEVNQQKGFEKSIDLGTTKGFGKYKNKSEYVSLSAGYRFSNNIYLGVSAGLGQARKVEIISILTHNKHEYQEFTRYSLFFAQLQAKYYLNQKKINPFIGLNAGYSKAIKGGIVLEPNIGLDYKIDNNNSIYILAGVNLEHYKYEYNFININNSFLSYNKGEVFYAFSFRAGYKF